jgi:hypothetical protein
MPTAECCLPDAIVLTKFLGEPFKPSRRGISSTYHNASSHQLQDRFITSLHQIHDVDAKTLAQAR